MSNKHGGFSRRAEHITTRERRAHEGLCVDCGAPAGKKQAGTLSRRCDSHNQRNRDLSRSSRHHERKSKPVKKEVIGNYDGLDFVGYYNAIGEIVATAENGLTVRGIHEALGDAARREWTLDALGVLEAKRLIRPNWTLPTRYTALRKETPANA